MSTRGRAAAWLIWIAVASMILVPVLIAAFSPLQIGRELVYIVGGMAGVLAVALMLLQPLLVAGCLPGVTASRGRYWHRCTGLLIVLFIALHIVGLYLTSPDDMLDALLLRAPTPFSIYGVVGLWAIVLTALVIVVRPRSRAKSSVMASVSPRSKSLAASANWRIVHNVCALVALFASVTHAWMIEGMMGAVSKRLLCISLLLATVIVVVYLRLLKPYLGRRH